jgi:trk system potassium uptake protein TrkH
MLSESLQLAPVDAVFESISGLTTTGATVLTGLDDMAPSILLYRHLLQWLGGIGIIVVAVAVLPMLGIGGMQLYRAETPGPSKDSKLTPRITETAKALFSVYLLLTDDLRRGLCAGGHERLRRRVPRLLHRRHRRLQHPRREHGLLRQQQDLPDLQPVHAHLGDQHRHALHRLAAAHLRLYVEDSEAKFFLSAMAVCVVITCAYLLLSETLPAGDAAVHGLFQAVSITTTTGYATQNFAVWPAFYR